MDGCGDDEGFVVRVRGLPWSASQEEVASFLEGCNIVDGVDGVHFTFVRDGRPSGEAYIELESEDDLAKALSKDKHHMGRRYIEVFQSKKSEMDWVVKRSGQRTGSSNNHDAVIRLRGLPFGCSKEEIAHFFTGLEIVPNGISLLHDHQGRTTGDAYVQFASQEAAERAQQKHKERIGHRYIEIFKSSLQEARTAIQSNRMRMGGMGRPSPYDRVDRFGGGPGPGMGGMGGSYSRGRGRGNIKSFFDDNFDDFGGGFGGGGGGGGNFGGRGGMMNRRGGGGMGGGGMGMGGGMGGGMGMRGSGGGGGGGSGGGMGRGGATTFFSQTGHSIHMRGLPFAATEQDILDFYRPMNPVNVVIHYNKDGRASGEADVDFATHEEAQQAMNKDRATMQHRYIELFMKSTPSGRSSGGGNMGSGGGGGSGMGNSSMNSGFGNNFGSMDDGFDGNGSFGSGYGSGMGGNMGSGMGSSGFGNNMGSGMSGNSMGNPNYTAF